MQSPRVVGHVILGTGLGLALLIAWSGLSQERATPGRMGSPLGTRTGPVSFPPGLGGRPHGVDPCFAPTATEHPQPQR